MIEVKELIDLMEAKGVASRAELVGVSANEIARLEGFFNLQFPSAYRTFLRHFGRSAGYLSPWAAIYFDDLKEIKEHFEEINRQQKSPVQLPNDALIIAHWDMIFDFILCTESQDPTVFRVDFGNQNPPTAVRYTKSYTTYLQMMIRTSDQISLPSELTEDDALFPLEDVIHF